MNPFLGLATQRTKLSARHWCQQQQQLMYFPCLSYTNFFWGNTTQGAKANTALLPKAVMAGALSLVPRAAHQKIGLTLNLTVPPIELRQAQPMIPLKAKVATVAVLSQSATTKKINLIWWLATQGAKVSTTTVTHGSLSNVMTINIFFLFCHPRSQGK